MLPHHPQSTPHVGAPNNPASQAQAQAQAHAAAVAAAGATAATAAGRVQKRPTDRTLPSSLSSVVPESALYTDLQSFEKRLDWTITRKRTEIQDGMARPVRTKRILRVFLSNLAANQGFGEEEKEKKEGGGEGMDEDGKEDGAASSTREKDGPPSWTLKIEGRLLEPATKSRAAAVVEANAAAAASGAFRFSNLIRSLSVELDRDPALYPDSNFIEWRRVPGQPAMDGFEIKRLGDSPCKAKIMIYLDHVPERYRIDPGLGELLDIKEETRAGVISALWGYIKNNRLQDEGDRRAIKFDEPLKKIFRAEGCMFQHLPQIVNQFLRPPEPIVLEYIVRVDTEHHIHPVAYDIEIEMDDPIKNKMHSVLAGLDPQSKTTREIAEIDEQIAQTALSIRNAKLKRDFLTSFATSPQTFLQNWIRSQARDLELILGGDDKAPGATAPGGGLGREEIRRAETWRGGWVEEAVTVSEARRLQERMKELQSGA